MSPICRWTVLLAALTTGCTGDGPAASAADARRQDQPAADVERIAHAYHGLLLDADLKEIRMDVALVASFQASLYGRLLGEADPKLQDEIRLLRLDAEKSGFGTEDMVLADNGILGTLLERSAEKLRARYDWRYRMVRGQAWQLIDITLHPSVLEWLRKNGLAGGGIPAAGDAGAYVAQCRAESVPTPPEFPSVHWGRGKALEPEFDFLNGDRDARVYIHQNADGVCYALPRSARMLLGIICQSARTGRACFYDNLHRDTGARIDWTRDTLTVWDIQNGNDLDDACTDCHRGTNAFIIHPGSALDSTGVNTNAAVRYTPIGGPAFVNPGPLALPALTDPEQGSCEGCHEIPRLTGSYCQIILARAAQTTMPYGEPPAGWLPPDTHAYYLHLAFLWERCPAI